MLLIDLEDLISQSDAARLRGVSRQAISELIARGRLDTFCIAGKHLLSKAEVANHKDGRTTEGRRQAAMKFK